MTALFRELVIRPALQTIGRWDPCYENLIFLTFLSEINESRFVVDSKEIPGMGPYNITPDIYQKVTTWLNSYPQRGFKEICLCACFYDAYPPTEALVHNLRWSTIVVYIHYYLHACQMFDTKYDDVDFLARYYRDYYRSKDEPVNLDYIKHAYKEGNKEV